MLTEREILLTIILPCLDEAETLKSVIEKSFLSLERLDVGGEVIVADNGSTDGSQSIVLSSGARLIDVPLRGYGSALKSGIAAARGKYVIMGDADDSYALDDLDMFFLKLNEGYELVMGNRFAGGIEPGAMPWLHKYIGNPVLSWLGRLFFKVPIKDFHCGLRGFNRESIMALNLNSAGMEFASEMVVKASLNNLRIAEVPTTLSPDGRSRAPHLRTWRDGWRHLIFLLAASPRWLFLYPGAFLSCLGTIGMVGTSQGAVSWGGVHFNLNTYFLSLGILLVGIQTVLMAILARVFSTHHGILPSSRSTSRFEKYFTLEKGIGIGLVLVLASLIGLGFLVSNWTGSGFRSLNIYTSFRISGLFVLTLTAGIQLIFASFFASMMQA
jgi:glycosyltransferase involved in cell wall biosynthesis